MPPARFDRGARRIALWGLTTVSTVVLLFSYRTSTSSTMPAAAGTPTTTDDRGELDRARRRRPPRPRPRAPTPGTVTGTAADTRWGPVQVRVTLASGKITAVDVHPGAGRQRPRPADQRRRGAAAGVRRPSQAQSSADRHGQRRDVHLRRLRAVAAERARPGRCGVTAPTTAAAAGPVARRVEHVMGMPISLALRGRHTDDAAADAAWAAVLESLRDADAVFSTYRADSVVSAIRRGELALADAPDEVHEVLAIGARAERATDGAFSVWRPDSTAAVSTPASWSRAGPSQRASTVPARPARHRLLPVRRRRHGLPRRPRRPLAHRDREPPRPHPRCSPSSRSATAPSPPRAPPTAAHT